MYKKEKIKRYINTMIKSGKWLKESKTLSENQFSIKFGCSRLTARQALRECVSSGLLVSRQGRGYFVSISPLKQTSDTNIKTHFIQDAPVFLAKEIKIFSQLSENFEDFSKNPFTLSLYKTYLNSEGKSFQVLKSYLFNEKKEYDADLISKSIASHLESKKLIVSKKRFKVLCEKVPEIVSLKLESKTNDKIPTVYSVLSDENGNILECSIVYTKHEDFVLDGESDLLS